MSNKVRNIISILFLAIPSTMLLVSGAFKLSGAPMIVEGMSKIGYGSYYQLLGVVEIIFVALLWYPKTWKTGFYFSISYLGGAAAIEISTGQFPNALVLIAGLWIGVYLKENAMFANTNSSHIAS